MKIELPTISVCTGCRPQGWPDTADSKAWAALWNPFPELRMAEESS